MVQGARAHFEGMEFLHFVNFIVFVHNFGAPSLSQIPGSAHWNTYGYLLGEG
jgi:hypothetical protein